MKISDEIVQVAAGAYRDGATHESAIRCALSAVLPKLMVKADVDVATVRVVGFREGLEAAAKWHEEQASAYEAEYSNLNVADELAVEHRGSATAIRALSAEPAQAEQWRDMKDAPKDTMLILACATWPLMVRGRAVPIKIGGYWDDKWNVFGASWTPTHWMPLPAAPTSEVGQ